MEDKNQTVATRVKELRKTRNIPQCSMAQKLNITATTYNRIENGKTQITVPMLYAIAAVLDVPVNELLVLATDNMIHNKADPIKIISDDDRVLLSISAEELKKHLLLKP